MYTIVTGAVGALAQTVCRELRKNGHMIIGIDCQLSTFNAEHIEQFYGHIDLTDYAIVEELAARIQASGVPISGLVNIAGGFAWSTILDASSDTWDKMWQLNTLTSLNASKAFIPLIQRQKKGVVINIGASAAKQAELGMGPYAASKSAVARLTEALAEELKKDGIRVNSILPSIIDTPANRRDMPDADFSTWVTPQEIANTIAFLSSDLASGITGAHVAVNGRV
jgi:NAD(P)-dependent dehydrogenase (short-subunit alcohol dehydrogenase family)